MKNPVSNWAAVSTSPRLHLGLLDCGNATLRQFGGIGLAIDGLRTEVHAVPSVAWEIDYEKDVHLSQRTHGDVQALLERLHDVLPATRISVKSSAPEHMGLGSKTSLLLAITTAAFAVYKKKLPRQEIIKLTQRGGTSGAGVNLFWEGGLVIDSGHDIPPEARTFAP